MKLVIITHVQHIQDQEHFFGYAPYVREMNIWLKYIDEVIIVAPLVKQTKSIIDITYQHPNIDFRKIPGFSINSFKNISYSLFKIPVVFWSLFWAMKSADHIHLRCPGNIGLLGCLVQVLFPKKKKTAKYAGNWDPKSKQPFTYKLQKYILSNTFFTRNMQVLVYGDWPKKNKNVKSFFTATYSESEKVFVEKTDLNSLLKFIFVGTLVSGKNPLYAVKLIEKLKNNGHKVMLDVYGEGIESNALKKYIKTNNLEKFIIFHGNKDSNTLKEAYQKSHFVILPSKSEGWPKAIAEGMFWGCVPIASKVSCIPFMLDYGARGILLEMSLDQDIEQIEKLIKTESSFDIKSQLSVKWSQNYTTDVFETEIQKLLAK
ncbi:glycosyltransferase [Flavobacterium sp. N502540]|uniref:glycosyltransferase n=1 Tax=Flavobacterium sp. N502540 TaxID=2986838 RepID=UPI0022241B24|nr:glycosyltransferase [Flavobacterium sp. N502540]